MLRSGAKSRESRLLELWNEGRDEFKSASQLLGENDKETPMSRKESEMDVLAHSKASSKGEWHAHYFRLVKLLLWPRSEELSPVTPTQTSALFKQPIAGCRSRSAMNSS